MTRVFMASARPVADAAAGEAGLYWIGGSMKGASSIG